MNQLKIKKETNPYKTYIIKDSRSEFYKIGKSEQEKLQEHSNFSKI